MSDQNWIVRGELADAMDDLQNWSGPPEVIELLVEGPRGSAKSHNSIMEWVWNLMCQAPGVRILVVRKFRSTLSNTFCQTFENEVVPPEMHASVVGEAQPDHRTHYDHPVTGSWCGLVGLDRPSKYQGMNIDVLFLEEASELTWKQVEPFIGALRKFTPGIKWQLLVALTNPDAPSHWLNQRAKAGKMRRVKTVLTDNPKYFYVNKQPTPEGAAFMKSLERYTGVSRKRHVLGEWAGAEGMVLDNWNEDLHLVEREANIATQFGIKSYFAAQDWGYAKPGALTVWGVTNERYLVRVAEAYHTKKMPDWWADWAIRFVDQYKIERIECDPADPKCIRHFNDRLVRAGFKAIARAADNTKASSGKGDLSGLNLLRWGLDRDELGRPRMVYLKNSLVHAPDPELVDAQQPTCTEEEIPSYVHARDATGEIIEDTTDDACPDHGIDTSRYAATSNWKRDTKGHAALTAPKFGSYASVMMQRNPEAVREWLEVDAIRVKAALQEAKR